MSSLLGQVVPMALAAAISPVIFLLQLNTLIGPRALARGSAPCPSGSHPAGGVPNVHREVL